MKLIESIDPFLMQLFIVPLIAIGLGILGFFYTKKILVAPLITLLLNLLYEIWYWNFHYPGSEILFSSWNIIFPVISFAIAFVTVIIQKLKSKKVLGFNINLTDKCKK